MIACIGLAVASCGNHDEKKPEETQPIVAPVPVPVETPKETKEEKTEPKPEEHHTPTSHHGGHTPPPAPHHHKDTTLVVTKGIPVIKDTAILVKKPDGGGTMGSTPNPDGSVKHHPKPGGAHGNTPPKSN